MCRDFARHTSPLVVVGEAERDKDFIHARLAFLLSSSFLAISEPSVLPSVGPSAVCILTSGGVVEEGGKEEEEARQAAASSSSSSFQRTR
ncbi:unnamed protein product [Bursaphelenchus xylophilus]|uniref:(pine wood nematode) hypothetical protein n=1 Tax=Bursaphelenchus xylophilus TaxID=6326 RepID=A0A1I7SQN3_BURXY|nr:unnamed protein product [Bursaphelenchus xylophilus]CAG9110140.1 unnamed protein product [Bursaphelenchus xylophilus]